MERSKRDNLRRLQLARAIFRAVHYVPSSVLVDDSKWDGVDGDNKKRKGDKHKMKKTLNKKQVGSIDDYIPIMREEGSMAFETYDEDFDFVATQNPKHVWTLVDGDSGDPVIVAGLHFVNRIHYIITIKPWEDENLSFPYVD